MEFNLCIIVDLESQFKYYSVVLKSQNRGKNTKLFYLTTLFSNYVTGLRNRKYNRLSIVVCLHHMPALHLRAVNIGKTNVFRLVAGEKQVVGGAFGCDFGLR